MQRAIAWVARTDAPPFLICTPEDHEGVPHVPHRAPPERNCDGFLTGRAGDAI
jgi:hypothetical protein